MYLKFPQRNWSKKLRIYVIANELNLGKGLQLRKTITKFISVTYSGRLMCWFRSFRYDINGQKWYSMY